MKQYSGKPAMIKKVNRNIVLNIIAQNPGISQPEIAALTDLSLATVNKTVKEIADDGSVISCGLSDSTGGRRAMTYRINEDSDRILCIYIKEASYSCAVATVFGSVVSQEEVNHQDGADWLEELTDILNRLIGEIGKARLRLIGVAVPGTVCNGIVFNIPAIEEWENLSLEEILTSRTGCTVCVQNDVKSATVGVCSQQKDMVTDNMIFISMLTSVGAGVVVNGKLCGGHRGFSGEFAYMTAPLAGSRRGPWGSMDVAWQAAIKKGDHRACRELAAQMIVNACCVIDPERIIIATPYLQPSEIPMITELVAGYIKREFMPQILIQNGEQPYLAGLIRICVDRADQSIKLVGR